MTSMQKFAWFNLAVIALTLVVVLSLFPVIGMRSMGGLGCLGLIGFSPLFFRQRPGRVVADERDVLIQCRSWVLAYSLFWVVFVLIAVFVSAQVYGWEGSIPVPVVQMSVAWGFIFVYAVASIAILVQYSGGARNAGE